MRLKLIATIATALVIVAGFIMISPLFLGSNASQNTQKQRVMLSFSISQHAGSARWSRDLSAVLNAYRIGAAVFIAGSVAEQFPQSISYFSDRVDIGNQTYSNADLTGISDYSVKLQEVREGKQAVDRAGNLDSRLFRAPFGATDQDIYSLLSRSGILADFSYDGQYNVYQGGQFIRYDAVVYKGREHSPEFFSMLPGTPVPLIIVFDDSDSISSIKDFLSGLKMKDFEFVNASQLVGFALTTR